MHCSKLVAQELGEPVIALEKTLGVVTEELSDANSEAILETVRSQLCVLEAASGTPICTVCFFHVGLSILNSAHRTGDSVWYTVLL